MSGVVIIIIVHQGGWAHRFGVLHLAEEVVAHQLGVGGEEEVEEPKQFVGVSSVE